MVVFAIMALESFQQVAARMPRPDANDPGQDQDWRNELRRVPRPYVDPLTGTKSIHKHFLRRDPETHAETFLSYNTTIPPWLYVDLDDAKYAVRSACFFASERPGRTKLVVELPEHAVNTLTEALNETTQHETEEGLLHLGFHPCNSNYPDTEDEVHFYLNFTDGDISSDQSGTVAIEVGEASADKFLGDTLFTFWTNDTALHRRS